MQNYSILRETMVDTQVRPSDVTKFPIIDAMLSVPREAFLPDALRDVAYMGENIELAQGRCVLEPRTIAKMLDGLNVTADELVLDVAPALGYSTALLAQLAEAVVAVEEDEDMASEAEANLGAHGIHNAAVITGPLTEGSAKHGPYDVIVIQGGVSDVPQALLDQLKEGGRIAAIFMSGALGEVRIGHKIEGAVNWRMEFNAAAPVLPGFSPAPAFVF